jgi:hypothetical protein
MYVGRADHFGSQGRACICNSEFVQFNGTQCLLENVDDGTDDCLVRIVYFLLTSILSPCIFAASRFVKADCFNVVLCQHQGRNSNEIAPKCFVNYKADGHVFVIPREYNRFQPIALNESSLAYADVEMHFHVFPFFQEIEGIHSLTPTAYNFEFQKQLDKLREDIIKYSDGYPPEKVNERFESISSCFERKSKLNRNHEENIKESEHVTPTDKRGFSKIIEHFPIDSSVRASLRQGMQFEVKAARAGLNFPEGAMIMNSSSLRTRSQNVFNLTVFAVARSILAAGDSACFGRCLICNHQHVCIDL